MVTSNGLAVELGKRTEHSVQAVWCNASGWEFIKKTLLLLLWLLAVPLWYRCNVLRWKQFWLDLCLNFFSFSQKQICGSFWCCCFCFAVLAVSNHCARKLLAAAWPVRSSQTVLSDALFSAESSAVTLNSSRHIGVSLSVFLSDNWPPKLPWQGLKKEVPFPAAGNLWEAKF